ncbi:PREDICTED: ribonuclease inhibitor-like, partial [Gekko japonicus]|uniref:Ribonuclease inhibitor-like n=1 Tax=Gekko japonicus TaxID=146911 RepID=A0ABM1LDH5_GEKJA
LQNCNLTKACCENLRSILSTKPSLTELRLGDNRLGTSGVKVLCQGLLDPKCQLQKLQLEYCELSPANAEALSSALRTTASLTELNLSNNKLGDAAVKQLCQGLLDANCKLQSLQLENCRITDAICGDLGTILSAKPSLKELCIGENKIGDAGAALLCQSLLDPNCKIEKLCLSVERMWLASVLSKNGSLTELHIGGNNLRDEGVAQLCDGLMDPNCTLQSLWLGNSELTPA